MRYVQPIADVRCEGIQSRSGLHAKAVRVRSLKEVDGAFDVIGIDEVHMLQIADMTIIKEWLDQDKIIIASGLDIDYQGRLMPVARRLFELKPEELISKPSVCEICREYTAAYTQILANGIEITDGLPPLVPEDGVYEYQARCRKCFILG